jgi:AcrR family transcriptional regulator
MSRPALYHYLPTKDAFLERLVEDFLRRDARALAAINQTPGLSPGERLREMAEALASSAIANPLHARILAENRANLPDGLAEADAEARRSIVAAIQAVVEQGIRQGDFRPLDARVAALAIIGMCLWTAWWVGEQTPQEAQLLAGQIAGQAVSSVLLIDLETAPRDTAALLTLMRENLDHLDRIIHGH